MMTLSEYRIKKKLTVTALAEELGFSVPYTSQLLNGTRNASINTAREIEKRTGGKVKAVVIMGLAS